MKSYFIIGGAGFIGSHLVKTLLADQSSARITIYDNFSSGHLWHLEGADCDPRVLVITADLKDLEQLTCSMAGSDIVYHFASNPDIAKAVKQPDIDFWEGTYLTNNVLEAMRRNSVRQLLYASGSGIYGDTGYVWVKEDHHPMLPISTYGASKLGCEALICSYCYMFGMQASAFRFANVVGPHQTHGVGYDFVRKLMDDHHNLEIFGDGTQSKSYIYISDILDAMRLMEKENIEGFTYFNVATRDYLSVTEIANMSCEIMGLKDVHYCYTGGNRGWKGDVPIIRLSSAKIRKLGWKNQYSTKKAMRLSIQSIYQDAQQNKFNWGGKA